MKRFLICALIASMLVPISARSQAVGAAPADEYFGRLKMSPIGMRNRLSDLVSTAVNNPDEAAERIRMAERVEDSIEDLATKYPRDSWVEGLFIGLERYYAHLQTDGGNDHLMRLASWMHEHMRRTASEFQAQLCADRVVNNARSHRARCETDEDLTVGLAYHRWY